MKLVGKFTTKLKIKRPPIKGRCPWCKHKNQDLIAHHIDYRTDLQVFICKTCHYKEHFPKSSKGQHVLQGPKTKAMVKQIQKKMNKNSVKVKLAQLGPTGPGPRWIKHRKGTAHLLT